MRKRSYREGDWFAVPLRDGGYGVGLVARMDPQGAVLLGYFFGPRRISIPEVREVQSYEPSNAVMVRMFGSLELERGNWPIIGPCPDWDRKKWPMPAFGRLVEHDGIAWKVEYPDDNPNATPRETRITMEEYASLPNDGMLGAGAAEILLTRALQQWPATENLPRKSSPDVKPRLMRVWHYLYFPRKSAADAVARQLISTGYAVEIRESGQQLLVLAQHDVPDQTTLDLKVRELEQLAAWAGGVYDGLERETPAGAAQRALTED